MSPPTASQLDRAIACPASVTLPQAPSTGAAAGAGHAIHAYLADPAHALDAVPEEHRDACEAIDLAALPAGAQWAHEVTFAWEPVTGHGRELGRDLGRNYTAASETEFVGTADVVGLTSDAVWIWDYKSGFRAVPAPARNWQLRMLAIAATSAYGRTEARVGLIHLNGDTPRFRSAMFDALDLDVAAAELRAAMRTWTPGATPVQGDHCAYCPAFDACPAKLALFRQAVDMPALTDENAAAVYLRCEAVAQVLGRVRGALEMRAKEHPIALPDGTVYGPVVTERESVEARVVQAQLTKLHGPEVAAKALEIKSSKAAIERAIATVAKRGEKAKLVTAALDAIGAADGINTKRTETVKVHRPKETE